MMIEINLRELMKIFFILLFLSISAFADSEKKQLEKGHQIAVEIEQANEGFIGQQSKMEMILKDAHGLTTTREMDGKILEVKDDGDKSIHVYIRPSDVKGTKMLTWSHKADDDDQWLYLPSIRRVKRISSSGKTASYMGSEFSYEDLGSQEIEKYDHVFISEDKNSWILERYPKKKSGYQKQKMWISKKYMNPIKIEYYDRKGELLKTATFNDYQAYKVKNKTLYRPTSIEMQNIQTRKSSTFKWNQREVGVKFSQEDFEQSSLR